MYNKVELALFGRYLALPLSLKYQLSYTENYFIRENVFKVLSNCKILQVGIQLQIIFGLSLLEIPLFQISLYQYTNFSLAGRYYFATLPKPSFPYAIETPEANSFFNFQSFVQLKLNPNLVLSDRFISSNTSFLGKYHYV